MNLEEVKKFLAENEEGKAWMEEVINSKMPKPEDPKDLKIKELQKQLEHQEKDQLRQSKIDTLIKSNKNIPSELIKMLVTDDEEVTSKNIKVLEDTLKQYSKENLNSTTPYHGEYVNGNVSKEQFMSMSYQEKKQLRQTNPDVYESLINN